MTISTFLLLAAMVAAVVAANYAIVSEMDRTGSIFYIWRNWLISLYQKRGADCPTYMKLLLDGAGVCAFCMSMHTTWMFYVLCILSGISCPPFLLYQTLGWSVSVYALDKLLLSDG